MQNISRWKENTKMSIPEESEKLKEKNNKAEKKRKEKQNK